ncbi:uncharacterized protein LOC144058019 isoform X2 [Vanacampus margaritifer]
MPSPILFDCEDGKGAATIRPASDNHKESPIASNKNPQMTASSKSAQQQPSVSTADKDHEGVQRKSTKESSVKKDIWAFLKKVQDSSQAKTKPKTLTPVKAPTPPPELEEEFLILDDDLSFTFSIPTKPTTKQNKNKESSSDKGSSIDRGSKDGLRETNLPSKNTPEVQTDPKKTTSNKREKKTELKHRNTPNNKNPQSKRKNADDQLKVVAGSQTDHLRVKPSSEAKTSSKAKRENPKSSRPTAKTKQMKAWHLESSSSKECEDAGLASPDKCSFPPTDFHPGKIDPAQGSAGRTFEQIHQTISSWSSPEECQVLGKRKRNPPGEWWLSFPPNAEQPEGEDEAPRVNKPKANRREATKAASASASASPVKADKTLKSTTKKDVKKATLKKKRALRKISASELDRDGAEKMRDQDQLEFPDQDSPLEQNYKIKHIAFPQVYTAKTKKRSKPLPSTLTESPEQLPDKRHSKLPGEWWKIPATPEEVAAAAVAAAAEPHQLLNVNHKTSKHGKKAKSKRSRPPKSAERAVRSPHSRKAEDEKQTRGVVSNGTLAVDGGARQSHEVVQVGSPDCQGTITVEGSQSSLDNLRDNICPSRHALQSGPVCMIDLEPHDDEDLPSNRHSLARLSVSDLCADPLKPCTVEFSDKADLIEWLQLVFSTNRKGRNDKNLAVALDHFDWYYYKSGAMGITEDVHWWNLSQGKMLLGSFMKKPLWVDHSANMGCFLITSSVKVKIDCTESDVDAGSFFTVPCGHAYSLENLTEQPALISFSRVLADSPD